MQIGLYHMFNFGFALIYAILGILILTVHIPKETQFIGYRKSRHTLGVGFVLMFAYCIFRTLIEQEHNLFLDFWILTTVSLLFSWLNHTAFLFLIKSEHKIRQHFIADGVAPLVLMILMGVLGILYPKTQDWVTYLLGAIFLVKCGWMFYTCDREWRKVSRDLEDNYDTSPEIGWMRQLLWITLVLSVFTLIAWYIPTLQILYAIVGPVTHIFMVLKVVNYSPTKICEMRNLDGPSQSATPISTTVSKSIAAMLEPKIEKWVEEKRYCEANLSIKDVAMALGTNHSYLSKFLNSHLNISFQVWLNTLRIEESKRILATEILSIEEVGAKVGIPQSYNFSRWFKIVTGETPLKYRQHINKARA